VTDPTSETTRLAGLLLAREVLTTTSFSPVVLREARPGTIPSISFSVHLMSARGVVRASPCVDLKSTRLSPETNPAKP
jgi:hypothetical protein